MKPKIFFAVCALLALNASFAFPAERRWKVIAGYDYYFPENSGEGLRAQLGAGSDALLLSGYDSTSYGVDTKGGTGARAGILYPFADHVWLGGTLGYIIGPTINANFSARSAGLGNGGLTISRAVGYARLLSIIRVHLADAGRWGFDLGSGWGAAVGNVNQSCTSSGSLTCPFTNANRQWAGFAWEVSPNVTYRLENATLIFAPRYAGLPRFTGNDQIPPIDWQTFGFFFGATF